MTRRDQRNYCIKKVKRGQRRSWKADRTQKQSQADEEWNKESQTYWIRRYSTWSFGGSHGAAWMKADKETCGKKIQTQLKKKKKISRVFRHRVRRLTQRWWRTKTCHKKLHPLIQQKKKDQSLQTFLKQTQGT